MTAVDVQKIGVLHVGVEGSDEYVLMRFPDPISIVDAREWLLSRVYRDTHQEAGGYFCNSVTMMPHPLFLDVFVGVIHHRYDV